MIALVVVSAFNIRRIAITEEQLAKMKNRLAELGRLRLYRFRIDAADEALRNGQVDLARAELQQIEEPGPWWEFRRLRYEVARGSGSPETLALIPAGRNPVIIYDRENRDVVWVGDNQGDLRRLHTNEDQSREVISAHRGSVTGVTWVGPTGPLMTAGRDGELKFWEWKDERIKPASPEIRHGRPVLCLAASHSGRLIAFVDSDNELSILQCPTGAILFQTRIGRENASPTSLPCIGFNCDDSLLATFGQGGRGAIFTTPEFRELLEHKGEPGESVTSLLWHPTKPELLLLANDGLRYEVVSAMGGEVQAIAFGLRPPSTRITALLASPEGSRWFLLEESGRFAVLDPEYLGEVLFRKNQHGVATGMAMNREGTQLAVSYEDGSLVIWKGL
jgi:WD40 repeat protein